jgi:hypothetical protein
MEFITTKGIKSGNKQYLPMMDYSPVRIWKNVPRQLSYSENSTKTVELF